MASLRSILAGHYGKIEMNAGLYLSDVKGTEIEPLTNTTAISVDLDNERPATWGITASMPYTEVFNPLEDYVKMVVDVNLNGSWERYPMGLYRFNIPDDEALSYLRTWNLIGFSAEQLLEDDLAENGYDIPPGTFVLSHVRSILMDRLGIPATMINFPHEDVALQLGILFDIVQDTSNCYYLPICNKALEAAGFTRLSVGNDGKWLTEKAGALNTKTPSVRYGESDGDENLFSSTNPIPVVRDQQEFANSVIVISNDIEQIPPVCAIVVNDDPNHPYSTKNYRRVERTLELQQIIGPVEARALGQEDLDRRGGILETIRVETPCDPERGPNEVCTVNYYYEDGTPAMVGRYRWTSFGFDVNDRAEPSMMTHALSLVGGLM